MFAVHSLQLRQVYKLHCIRYILAIICFYDHLHYQRSQTLTQPELANKLFTTVQQSKFAADRYLESCGCLHFLFKYRPLMTKPKPGESGSASSGGNAGNNSGSSGSTQPLPTQYVQSNMGFPLDDPVINEW